MASFFSRLSYSFGNEDWKSDQTALKIQPEDHVLCITASGDRPLNLLVNDCHKIDAVDANPIQNYLLDLKVAAMKKLNHDDFLQFIGAEECKHRSEMFKTLDPHLSSESREYWKQNRKKIAKGVLYQGAIEKWCQRLSIIIRMLKGSKHVDQLLEFNDLKKQSEFVNTVWNTNLWRKSFELVLRPALTKPTMKDPGLYAYIGSNINPANYIYSRMQSALHRGLAKENPLVTLILDGRVAPEAFPPCLTKEGIAVIQSRLNKITIHSENVVDFLEKAKPNSYDCFSMSDVASYLNPEDYRRMLKAILSSAKPKARFCIRQFLSGYTIPPDLAPHFIRNEALEKEVEDNDRCFVYRYMVGEIKK